MLQLSQDGSLSMVLKDHIELTPTEIAELGELEQAIGLLHSAESTLKRELDLTTQALLKIPEYQKFILIKEKIKTAKKMQRNTQVLLDDKYEQVFQKRGMPPAADVFLNALPPVKTPGKRGRPRKVLP